MKYSSSNLFLKSYYQFFYLSHEGGSIRAYSVPVSFLALARTLSLNTKLIVYVTARSFLNSLSIFFFYRLRVLYIKKSHAWTHSFIQVLLRSRMTSRETFCFFWWSIITRRAVCVRPHASHMFRGALHFRGIDQMVLPLSSPDASCRSRIGLLLY